MVSKINFSIIINSEHPTKDTRMAATSAMNRVFDIMGHNKEVMAMTLKYGDCVIIVRRDGE
jgi:intein/homing endonuclease